MEKKISLSGRCPKCNDWQIFNYHYEPKLYNKSKRYYICKGFNCKSLLEIDLFKDNENIKVKNKGTCTEEFIEIFSEIEDIKEIIMIIEADASWLGFRNKIDIDAEELKYVSESDLIKIYDNMSEKEKQGLILIQGSDYENAIISLLNMMDYDTASNIVKNLQDKFIGLDKLQEKLKKINE